ncbi:MAG TPA: DEAD/DEAH box helicase family protein [Pseudogracilibacillus sp.]|nr:DEAD/DEAH box helicase family protein [Pseudogracilibacillus sp.]
MTDQVKLIHHNLYVQLKEDIRQSKTIFILSAFLMESGVKLIQEDLQYALNQGADVKILTGDYMYVTQPKALRRLLNIKGDNLEVRLWHSHGVSFHPKSFMFNHGDQGAVIVGSSNLSKSALTNGVEWNVRINKTVDEAVFDQALDEFIHLFYADNTMVVNDETIKEYALQYDQFSAKHSHFVQKFTEQEEIAMTLPSELAEGTPTVEETDVEWQTNLTPRPSQEAALEALENTYAEGYNKSLVVMATGLGKTYLAAFFAKQFKKILFIAHREEILKQAQQSFMHVLQIKGGLYNGYEKDRSHPLLFASIYTLSMQEHLEQFDKAEFDLIVVDEFHHAAAKSYQKVIDYFEPKFLLGLTATPERTDGKDIFSICEGNVAYEINFIDAIRNHWLSPFKYYGVKDDINYDDIKWLGTRYDSEQLLKEQLNQARAKHIFNKWDQLKQTRTLAFCSSIKHAQYLSNYFNQRGVKAISLTSEPGHLNREEAIKALELKDIDVIFTVDLFNEGVDIPLVDTLLFVRPTESLIIFTQQIGRGLRLHDDKSHCVIIDLIGNYKHADVKLSVFNSAMSTIDSVDKLPQLPAGSMIDFEPDVIDLLKEMKRKKSPRREKLRLSYVNVKDELGRRPTYYEMHLNGAVQSKEFKQIYGGYFGFLYDVNELNELEAAIYEKYQNWFKKIESESMTKSYKMVVLQHMLEKGSDRWFEEITPEEVAPYFHQFYMAKDYRKNIDFSSKSNQALWEYDQNKVAKLIARMPMNKFLDKHNLLYFEQNKFGLTFDIEREDREIVHAFTKQICEYKLNTYFEKKMK